MGFSARLHGFSCGPVGAGLCLGSVSVHDLGGFPLACGVAYPSEAALLDPEAEGLCGGLADAHARSYGLALEVPECLVVYFFDDDCGAHGVFPVIGFSWGRIRLYLLYFYWAVVLLVGGLSMIVSKSYTM